MKIKLLKGTKKENKMIKERKDGKEVKARIIQDNREMKERIKDRSGERIQKLYNRSQRISIDMIGKTLMIYNGKEYKKIIVKIGMVGKKVGEYVKTRKNSLKNVKGRGGKQSKQSKRGK
jgi:ribosomal protein S19